MPETQAEIFLSGEGDNWHARNKEKTPSVGAVGVLEMILDHGLRPKRVLEVGAGTGWRLKMLRQLHGCDVMGIEPSLEASEVGRTLGIDMIRGTADSLLIMRKRAHDLIIFGFCLYLVDRGDLSKIVYGADNALEDQGYLIIHDFYSERAYSRTYAHDPRLRSYKTDYSRLFTSNPAYKLVEQRIYGTGSNTPTSDDDRVVVSLLKKDMANAWPLEDA